MPAADEVLIQVEACGVCHSDLHIAHAFGGFTRMHTLPGLAQLPALLAVDPAGRGEPEDTDPGQRRRGAVPVAHRQVRHVVPRLRERPLERAHGEGPFAEMLGLNEEATKELTDQVQEWADALAGFVDPLGTYTSMLQEKAQQEMLYAKAEVQNVRRRMEKDIHDARTAAEAIGIPRILRRRARWMSARLRHTRD